MMSSSEIIQTTANVTPGTVNQLLPSLLEAVRFNLGMSVGFISRFKDGSREFLHVSSDLGQDAPKPGDHDPLDESACLRVVNNQAPNLVHDAQTHPSLMDLSAIKALGVIAHVSVPIPSGDGGVFGTLCCYSLHHNEALDERDIGFMSVIADLIGTTLQREQRVLDDINDSRDYFRNVLKSDGLQMVWQPIVDTTNNEIFAVESLARFQTDPYRPPNEWFDEAVKLGIGADLEKSAFVKGMAIREHLPQGISVGCNLSGSTFLEPIFQEFFKQQNLDRIVLEITEHDVIADYNALTSNLSAFRKQGLRLAIDDFGDGYAGFRHIVELNPDTIKLDMSLVRDINRKPTVQSVVKALMGFAQENGTRLLAEGVETQAEFDTLRSLGIKRMQGYLFYKPMPEAELLKLFRSIG